LTDTISGVSLEKGPEKFKEGENVTVNVKFSITGALRQAFNEKNWEKAYNKHDNVFKLRYGIKLYSGGLRKREIGKALDTYKKVALFWTRNPKLTQMGERRYGYRYPRILSRLFQKTRSRLKSTS